MPRAWVREGRREKMETIGKGIIDGTAFFNWEGERERNINKEIRKALERLRAVLPWFGGVCCNPNEQALWSLDVWFGFVLQPFFQNLPYPSSFTYRYLYFLCLFLLLSAFCFCPTMCAFIFTRVAIFIIFKYRKTHASQ